MELSAKIGMSVTPGMKTGTRCTWLFEIDKDSRGFHASWGPKLGAVYAKRFKVYDLLYQAIMWYCISLEKSKCL